MRKILLIAAFILNTAAYADSSDKIDTIIENDGMYPHQISSINVYYASISDPLNGGLYIPYEKNPIILNNTADTYHIPPKKGYFVIVKDVTSTDKVYTHFSTCNDYFAPVYNYGYSILEVGFVEGGDIGYCGVYPSPDTLQKSIK